VGGFQTSEVNLKRAFTRNPGVVDFQEPNIHGFFRIIVFALY
jgi:hypothetical protein